MSMDSAEIKYKMPLNTGNCLGAGRKPGTKAKRTTTLVKEIYEGALLEAATHRLPAIMKQIIKDAEDPELSPHVRQKAQAMIIQAMQKTADQETAREIAEQDTGDIEIEISRDSLLVKSGKNRLRVDQVGGSFGQGGSGDEAVPYTTYPTSDISNTPLALTDISITDIYPGLDGEEYVPNAPNSEIPLIEFVGPHKNPNVMAQLWYRRIYTDELLNGELGWPEYYCVERPVSMNFNTESIDG